MNTEKINIKALARKIKFKLGAEEKMEINIIDIEKIIDKMIQIIKECLKAKEEIFLANFGTFVIQKRKATRRRNPQNGTEIKIPACDVIKFRVFQTFSKEVFGS